MRSGEKQYLYLSYISLGLSTLVMLLVMAGFLIGPLSIVRIICFSLAYIMGSLLFVILFYREKKYGIRFYTVLYGAVAIIWLIVFAGYILFNIFS